MKSVFTGITFQIFELVKAKTKEKIKEKEITIIFLVIIKNAIRTCCPW